MPQKDDGEGEAEKSRFFKEVTKNASKPDGLPKENHKEDERSQNRTKQEISR